MLYFSIKCQKTYEIKSQKIYIGWCFINIQRWKNNKKNEKIKILKQDEKKRNKK